MISATARFFDAVLDREAHPLVRQRPDDPHLELRPGQR